MTRRFSFANIDGWQDWLDLFHEANWAKIENVHLNELDKICKEWRR